MRNPSSTILFVVLFAFFAFTQCNDPVGVINYEQPEQADGTRQLVVKVTDEKNAPITGFALKITGPTSVDVNVAGNEYIFTNLASGLYTLQVSKPGFVGNTMEVPVTIPANPKLDYFAASDVRISALAAPVTVNNAQGGTVSIPGISATGPRSQAINVVIPPGAFGATGTSTMTITRRSPATIVRTGPAPLKVGPATVENLTRIPLDTQIIEVPGVNQFLQPVLITVPMALPNAIRTSTYELVVMSGSTTTGIFEPTSETIKMTITANGDLTASVTKPGIYGVYVNLGLTTTNTQSAPSLIGTTACNAGGNFTITSPTAPALGPIATVLSVIPPVATATSVVTVPAIVGLKTSVTATYNYIDYRFLSPTGSILETYRYPITQVTVTTTSTNCHDSGGN